MSYSTDLEIQYPDCDGNPMSDNTEQFRWIVMIKENLEILFATIEDVFVAGDLLWYPIEGDNVTRLAPDVMVVFGRPKGKRGSYQQWKEEKVAPQVAFEILSPSNSQKEMATKRLFYETHGIDEFYIYDPDRFRLTGWIRQGTGLMAIANMEGWVSPLLGIRFTQANGDLEIYRPDGRRFLSSIELDSRAEWERQRADRAAQKADVAIQKAEQATQQAEQATQQAEQATQQAEQATQQAEQAIAAAEAERGKAQRLADYLRSIGLDPDQI
jgi:Uma2 family endonuclease